jgi:hypothetical protein
VKKIILDENMPRLLARLFPGYSVTTVQLERWAGIQNGELIQRIDGNFYAFITADKNLRYQQNLKSRRVVIVELPFNRLSEIEPLLPRIRQVIDASQPGDYLAIT